MINLAGAVAEDNWDVAKFSSADIALLLQRRGIVYYARVSIRGIK
jgi:hypothetical protein